MGTLFRFRRRHVLEEPEVLPEPAVSIVDSHDDGQNTGGVHEVGGFHNLKLHVTTLWGASGVLVLLLAVEFVCYLCHRGIL